MSARSLALLIAASVFLAAAPRLLFPAADSPAHLSWSGGPYADEGFWSYDARNLAVFGRTDLDDWSNRKVAPISHTLSRLAFRLGGVGIAPLRITAGLLSCLAVVALALGLAASDGAETALLGTLLFGLCALAAWYGRLFLLETPATLLLTASFALLVARPWSGRNLVAGALAGAALATKTTVIPFLPAAVLHIGTRPETRLERLRSVAVFLAGAALPYGAYRWLVVAPSAERIARFHAYYSSQQSWSPAALLEHLITQPAVLYFCRSPVLLLLGLLVLVGVGEDWLRRRPSSPAARLAAFWLVGQVTLLACFGYRPLRYYVPVLPALAALAAAGLSGRVTVLPRTRAGRAVSMVLLLAAAGQAGLVLVDRLLLEGRLLRVSILPEVPWRGAGLLVILAAWSLVMLALRRTPTRRWAVTLLALFLAVNAFQYGHWLAARDYGLRFASRTLAERVRPTAVVAGQWAPALGLENRLRVLPLWKGFVNDRQPGRTYGITHLVAWQYRLGDEVAHQLEWFPELARGAETLGIFEIKGTPVFLLEVPR